MTILTSLLLSLSAGSATYAVGAIAWCTIDPEGAGAKLLFTIPVALASMAVPGIIGAMCLAFRCDFIREPKAARAAAAAVTTPVSAPAPRPTRSPRPQTATTAPATAMDEELELALAT